MTAKERLRSLVDELSEEEAATALVVVERRRSDRMLHALATAEDDDEHSDAQEDHSARQAYAAYRRGEALPADDFKRDLGLA